MEDLKLYFDFKSPYAYLAKDAAFALPERFCVNLRWIPFVLRIKGKGERSIYSEYKARYSYMDARRWANKRGGFRIMGPPKVYDSRPALIGGLWAERQGWFRSYCNETFQRFFERRLEIDEADEVAALLEELGGSKAEYFDFLEGEGAELFEELQLEAAADHTFGVPIFVFRGEQFWGQDRLPLLEERLAEAGLQR